jgi:hypothetical protein
MIKKALKKFKGVNLNFMYNTNVFS